MLLTNRSFITNLKDTIMTVTKAIYQEDMETFAVSRIPITFHLKASFDEKQRKKFEHIARKTCFVGNTLTAEKVFTFVYE